jgi:polysaccharide export outer membrane protein
MPTIHSIRKPFFHGLHRISFCTSKALRFCCLLLLIPFLHSCVQSKPVTYFADLANSAKVALPEIKRDEHKIETDDVLDIRVGGANEEAAARFNIYTAAGNASNAGVSATGSGGYLVDAKGEIDFPYIGKVKVGGLTKDQIKDKITKEIEAKGLLKNTLVSVRIVNFRFTVLGEVKTAGTFTVNNEKVTILDALGYAGDMTVYAKRNTVRVIRDSAGKREIGMVNFNEQTIFTSPYYYLHRNDVVYVEPARNRVKIDDTGRLLGILGSITSIIALVLSFTLR